MKLRLIFPKNYYWFKEFHSNYLDAIITGEDTGSFNRIGGAGNYVDSAIRNNPHIGFERDNYISWFIKNIQSRAI